MKKDLIFFGENGLTTTSANYLANIAKETYRMMEDTLNNYSFYTKKISLIGSDIEKTISLGNTEEELHSIPEFLNAVAQLKSFIAWIREAIKAKDRLIKEAKNLTDEEVAEALSIELPERPLKETVPTADDIIAAYNIKQRNRIYYLETMCSQIGSYIHPDGALTSARNDLKKALSSPNKVENTGRDTTIYSFIPTLELSKVDEIYFNLQATYRQYQAELNSLKHSIETAVQEEEKRINLEYAEALNNYCNSMNLLNAEIKAYKDTKITEAQSLKIIIPDSLKNIYNQLSNMGKE